MQPRFILKIVTLLALLFITLYAMLTLKDQGLSSRVQEALLVDSANPTQTPAGVAPPRGPQEIDIILCPTRVSALIQPSLFHLQQRGLDWVNLLPQEVTLHQVAVEKWFGQYCTIKGMATGGSKTESMQPLIYFEYVDGSREALLVSPTGVFAWQQKVFHSPSLLRGLQELRALVGSNNPSDAPQSKAP